MSPVALGQDVLQAYNGLSCGGMLAIGSAWPITDFGYQRESKVYELILQTIAAFCGPGSKKVWLDYNWGVSTQLELEARLISASGHALTQGNVNWPFDFTAGAYDFLCSNAFTYVPGQTAELKCESVWNWLTAGNRGLFLTLGPSTRSATQPLFTRMGLDYTDTPTIPDARSVTPDSDDPIFEETAVYVAASGVFTKPGTPEAGSSAIYAGIGWAHDIFAVWRT